MKRSFWILIAIFFPLVILAQNGNQESLSSLLQKATNGDADAQFALSERYRKGEGVESNLFECFKWCLEAAKNGNITAQIDIAANYVNGWGTPIDKDEALKWLLEAVKKRATYSRKGLMQSAVWDLAYLYENYKKDYKEAAKWYCVAATEGPYDFFGQNELGRLYFFGRGVAQSYSEAFKWCNKAVKSLETAESDYIIGLCYYYGKGTSQDFRQAFEQFNKTANLLTDENYILDDPVGVSSGVMFMLSRCYRYGRGVEKNEEKANYWSRKASALDDSKARQYILQIER